MRLRRKISISLRKEKETKTKKEHTERESSSRVSFYYFFLFISFKYKIALCSLLSVLLLTIHPSTHPLPLSLSLYIDIISDHPVTVCNKLIESEWRFFSLKFILFLLWKLSNASQLFIFFLWFLVNWIKDRDLQRLFYVQENIYACWFPFSPLVYHSFVQFLC